MLNLTKPRHVMPFHGDAKRQRLHAGLAESVGIDPDDIFIGTNGVALDIDRDGAKLGEDFHASMIFVDGVADRRARRVRDPRPAQALGRRRLHRRRDDLVGRRLSGGRPRGDLPRRGAWATTRPRTTSPTRSPTSSTRRSRRPPTDKVREIDLIQEDLHDDIAEFVWKKLKRRPLVLPVVVEV